MADEPLVFDHQATTPSSQWRKDGEPDPHAGMYDGERATLCMGHLTDDQLANQVYLYPDIASLTAAKERIRWLSRKLEESLERNEQLQSQLYDKVNK